MTDRDLAERLRQLAEAERMDREQPSVALTLDESADRIEALEAERAGLLASITELAPSDEVEVEGSIFQRAELPQVLRNVMRHLAGSQREAKAMFLRAEAAQARLARVTDDSMAERMSAVVREADRETLDYERREPDSYGEHGAAVLAAIRAAADQQEATVPKVEDESECLDCGRTDGRCDRLIEVPGEPEHTVACNAIWYDFGGCSCGATDEREAGR